MLLVNRKRRSSDSLVFRLEWLLFCRRVLLMILFMRSYIKPCIFFQTAAGVMLFSAVRCGEVRKANVPNTRRRHAAAFKSNPIRRHTSDTKHVRSTVTYYRSECCLNGHVELFCNGNTALVKWSEPREKIQA